MAKEYLDKDGLLYFWQKIKAKFVEDVAYDSTNKKITKTKNGTTSDVVTVATLKTDMNINVGVTGVKGNSESTYRTGNVNITAANVGAAPTSHASTATTYGKGTSGNYGHVKLSDATAGTDAAASGGVAATPKAVSDALAAAKAYADGLDTGVSDVTVDGTSVVTDGVAAVDLSGKVDKETGKGLSTNDYTTAEKTKLAGIATGAEVNVQADWDEVDDTSDAYIRNKPDIPEVDDALSDTSENPVQNKVINTALGNKAANTDFSGATSALPGNHGLVPKPLVGQYACVLAGNGKWVDIELTSGNATIGSKSLRSDNSGLILNFNTASTTKNGLMSSSDKAKVDKLVFDGSVIDSSILPSFVDDVVEAYARSGQTALSSTWLATGSASGTVITPEAGKIYVLMADSGDYAANTQFRWGGTAYVKLADGGVSSITNAEIDTIVAS